MRKCSWISGRRVTSRGKISQNFFVLRAAEVDCPITRFSYRATHVIGYRSRRRPPIMCQSPRSSDATEVRVSLATVHSGKTTYKNELYSLLITKASHTIQYELDLHFKGNSKLKRTCFSVVAAVLYANEVQGHAPSDTLKNDAFSRETAPDWVVLKRSRAIESDLDQC